jgi:hypothetical protein
MRLRDDVDVSRINWTNQAGVIRRYAEQLPPGARRNAEIDRRWRAKLSHTARIYCFKPRRDNLWAMYLLARASATAAILPYRIRPKFVADFDME